MQIGNLEGSQFSDRLIGNNLPDVLTGNDGCDLFRGGAGADTLTAGKGSDTLGGGPGGDSFRYRGLGDSPVGNGRDRIVDLDAGDDGTSVDRIDLRPIDANTGVAGDQAFTFISRPPSSTASTRRPSRISGQAIHPLAKFWIDLVSRNASRDRKLQGPTRMTSAGYLWRRSGRGMSLNLTLCIRQCMFIDFASS